MFNSCKLPLSFNPQDLKRDLDLINPADWVAHFNTGYYEGEWSGVALRSVGGVATQLYPDPNNDGPIADTAILARCPNLQRVLATFECTVRSARLLKLTPGSRIKEHRDYNLGFDDGEIRLHVPIVTNAGVDFFLDGRRVELNEGECWYLDFNLPHAVENRGLTDRIHLVIDCVVNDWIRELLPATPNVTEQAPSHPTKEPSSPSELERFGQFVLREMSLHQKLREIRDQRTFATLCVELGAEHGFGFSDADVEEAILTARQEWFTRWVE